MPYYHNFGWYYFAKYILGLAGMIFLYTGILKEKSIVCVCPAEQRERDRSKKPKYEYRPSLHPFISVLCKSLDNYTRSNECSPTGDPTDAPAKARKSSPFNYRRFYFRGDASIRSNSSQAINKLFILIFSKQ